MPFRFAWHRLSARPRGANHENWKRQVVFVLGLVDQRMGKSFGFADTVLAVTQSARPIIPETFLGQAAETEGLPATNFREASAARAAALASVGSARHGTVGHRCNREKKEEAQDGSAHPEGA